jgi:glycosyltransferase involved in cell wall biosynthesis
MTTAPLVSIIIRARDEEPSLRRLRPLLERQQTDFQFEVWLLDNDSTDETAAFAREAGWQYHHIPRGAFNYATALNQGAQLAQGQFCVSLSAHCFPQTERWLAELVRPLRENPFAVATYGRQWINPEISPFEALGNDMLFPPFGIAPAFTAFSNSNSAYRRDYALLHPFNPMVKILEDHLFLLELGEQQQVIYVPEALVHHEHGSFSWRYQLRRWWREGWSFFFITKHRGYSSPFIHFPLINPREILFHYPLMGAVQLKRGRFRQAIFVPAFFILRDLTWQASFIYARLRHSLMAQADTGLLVRTGRVLREHAARGGPVELEAPIDWPEEWQLKADWGFIRQNIAVFIRSCHEQSLIQSPLLEVGASGQNDYLAEWYEMRTSNLSDNMQGAALPLDMEDMSRISAGSLGTVLCSEVIEHVRHPERAIAEAFRVLRPGGTLILTTPYSIVIHNTPDDGGFHGRNFTSQGLELIVREAGFAIVISETRGRTEVRRRLMPSNVFLVARKP